MLKKIIYKILFLSLSVYSFPVFALCDIISSVDFEKLIHKKSPVTLIFFSSWCSDCKDELLEFKKKKQMKENYILVNTFDSPGKGEKTLKSLEINDLCIYDKKNELAKKFHVDSIPKNFLIPKN